MHIIYKITYLPHVMAGTPPYYYVGSKFNYNKKYMGSPASKQKDWYTEDLSIRDWWKIKITQEIHNFKFQILEIVETTNVTNLVEIEKKYHLDLNVREDIQYFNKSIATSGWVSAPRTELTKKTLSEKTKKYWNSLAGLEKRTRLVERNKTHHSINMKNRWNNPTEAMKKMKFHGRPKGAKDLTNRKPKYERKIFIEGTIYQNAKEATKILKLHPVSIRRKCKSSKFNEWRYIDD